MITITILIINTIIEHSNKCTNFSPDLYTLTLCFMFRKITCFYRASICEGGLGSRNSVCLSVCPSVCLSHAWIVTKLNDALQIFYTTRKGNHSATLIPRVVGRRRPLPSEICVQSDLPPFEKRRLRPISAHNVSTVGDSEKSSITTNIKSTTGFPTSHRWSAYVTPKCPKGWLKERFFRFLSIS